MTRTTTAPAPAADGVGKFSMPSMDDFASNTPPKSIDLDKPGRAVGIDYDQWAVAIIDLDDRPDRVAGHRLRMRSKGYRKVDGQPTVSGFPNPEVWVKPRDQWARDREAKGNATRAKVMRGHLPDSALCHPGVLSIGR